MRTAAAIASNTKFTDENIPLITDEICDLISTGKGLEEALNSLKAENPDKDYPGYSTFQRWLEQYDDVREKYSRARDIQQDYEADNIIHIADTEPDANKARNRILARQWRAAKLRPKKYGDYHGGITNNFNILSMTDEQLNDRIARLAKETGIIDVIGGAGPAEED